jgi:hypothetical protein
MVHQPGEEEKLPLPKPVGETMEAERPDAGIEKHVPARPGGRIPRFDGIEIADKP